MTTKTEKTAILNSLTANIKKGHILVDPNVVHAALKSGDEEMIESHLRYLCDESGSAFEDVNELIENEVSVFVIVDGKITKVGTNNGTRWYFSKMTTDANGAVSCQIIESGDEDESEEETEDDSDEDDGRVVICKDKSRYQPFERLNRVSLDCADVIAEQLRFFVQGKEGEVWALVLWAAKILDMTECPLPRKASADSWVEHVAKWQHVNNGQKRMLIGQALRTADKQTNGGISGILRSVSDPDAIYKNGIKALCSGVRYEAPVKVAKPKAEKVAKPKADAPAKASRPLPVKAKNPLPLKKLRTASK